MSAATAALGASLRSVAVLVAVPLVAPQFWVTLGNYIGLYSIVALGLVLLTGVAGQTSFGQAAFVGLGAYTTAVPHDAVTARRRGSTLPIGLALTAARGAVPRLHHAADEGPLPAARDDRLGHQPLLPVRQSRDSRRPHRHDRHSGARRSFGLELRNERYYYFLIWAITLAALWATNNLLDSRPGRAIRALRGGLEMAEAFGVDAARLKIVVFVYAALLACISGWLYAHLQRFVNPTPFGINQGIEYLFMAVVGGAGSVWGAVVGATLITLLKQVLQDDALPRRCSARHAGNFEIIVFGILMVAAAAARARRRLALDRAASAEARAAAGRSGAAPLPARERVAADGSAARGAQGAPGSSAASSPSTTCRSRSAPARSSA